MIKGLISSLRRKKNLSVGLKGAPLEMFSPKKIATLRRSDTLFVLGSSPSILAVTKEKWDQIDRADTCALNYFGYHPFVPRFYFFEFNPAWLVMAGRFFDYLAKRNDYKEVSFFFNFESMYNAHFNCGKLPENILSNSAIILPRIVDLSSFRTRRTVYRKFLESDWTREPFKSFFYARGSLMLVTQFAYLVGYKKVVLVGVDLANQFSFYQRCGGAEVKRHAADEKIFYKYHTSRNELSRQLTHTNVADSVSKFSRSPAIDVLLSEFQVESQFFADFKIYHTSRKPRLKNSFPEWIFGSA